MKKRNTNTTTTKERKKDVLTKILILDDQQVFRVLTSTFRFQLYNVRACRQKTYLLLSNKTFVEQIFCRTNLLSNKTFVEQFFCRTILAPTRKRSTVWDSPHRCQSMFRRVLGLFVSSQPRPRLTFEEAWRWGGAGHCVKKIGKPNQPNAKLF